MDGDVKGLTMQNKPQLSAEMEKRLEKFLTDTWGWSYEYGEWLDSESQPIGGIKDLKHFLATALEEQKQEFINQKANQHDAMVRADEREKVLSEVDEAITKRVLPAPLYGNYKEDRLHQRWQAELNQLKEGK